jgi:hypothetical protein
VEFRPEQRERDPVRGGQAESHRFRREKHDSAIQILRLASTF